jgi:cytosine/adenosine deaminase-related metal-dependent hydrolase
MLFHTHAAENPMELEVVRRQYGMENIEYLDSVGVLRSNTCLAHCVWVTEAELELLHKARAKVLHCPSSNLKLASGIAPVPRFLEREITVSLGADGAPCNNTLDVFTEMRLAALIQKPKHGPASMSAATVFELATLGGARTLGLEGEIGSIEPGKRADLVLLDMRGVWNPLQDAPEESVYSSIVYSASPENIRSVMVDGRWLYRDRVFLSLDERDVREQAAGELRRLLARARL